MEIGLTTKRHRKRKMSGQLLLTIALWPFWMAFELVVSAFPPFLLRSTSTHSKGGGCSFPFERDWDYHSFGRRPIDRVGDRSVIKIDSSSALPWCVLNRGQENVSVTTATLFYLYCIFPPSSSTSSSSQRGAKCCPMRGEPHSVGNDRRRVGKIHQDQLGAVAHSGLCVYVYVWRSLREHWGQTTRTPFFFHNCGEDHTILEGKS